MTHLAQQLKSLRTANKMSQDDLAEKLYISRQAISKWETGEATPDLDKLVQLAKILDVSLDELILGKEAQTIIERVVEKQERDIKQLVRDFWLIFSNILLAACLLLLLYALLESIGLTAFW
ncbi:helix-turn-helix domain-containing protein [Streptococcus pluranimalium]